MNNNPLFQFIAEAINRMTSKSPTFFKVWKVITGIPVLIIALPNFLQQLGIKLPQVFNDHVTTAVSWASFAMFFMSFLPTQSTAAGIQTDGTILKSTDAGNLPFTAAKERKSLAKTNSMINEMLVVGTVSTTVVAPIVDDKTPLQP